MLVIVDRPQLLRMIALVRDDRRPPVRGQDAPFMRMEASGESLTLTGQTVEATFPATVLEPGVLFLRIYRFRKLLHSLEEEKSLTIQVNSEGLMAGPVRMPLEPNDMLLYPDPACAPQRHPAERLGGEDRPARKPDPTLFDLDDPSGQAGNP